MGEDEGDISPFQALMTALAATIGTGNIAGVATAIYFGGPGAIFWMWVIALFGMATKYAEAVMAVKYREVDELGPICWWSHVLHQKRAWTPMAMARRRVCPVRHAGGIWNCEYGAIQHRSRSIEQRFQYPHVDNGPGHGHPGVSAVIIGGIKRIAEVAEKVVPFMAVLYFASAFIIILMHISDVPAALLLIVKSAFSDTAASGGFFGRIGRDGHSLGGRAWYFLE